jgi:hypothetical protein
LIIALGCSLGGLAEGVQEAGEQAQELAEQAEELASELDEETPAETAEEETVEPDAEMTSEEEAADETEPPESVEFDPDALEGLDSYRYSMIIRSEKGDGTTEEMTMEMAATRDPAAQHIIITGAIAEGEKVEVVQIGNQQWVQFGENWIQSQVEEEDTFDFSQEDLPFSAEDINDEALDNAKYVGKETVNGLPTRHYTIDTSSLGAEMLGWESMVDNIEEASMDVWIVDKADLPAFAARTIIEAKGSAPEGQAEAVVNLYMSMDVTDVNADFTIEPPEDAESAGLPEDIPVYPNRQNQTSMGGMMTFETEDEFATIVEFYTSEMEASGWSPGEGNMSTDTMEMQNWTKDARGVQLMISADEDTDLTSVTIILQEGE